MYRTQLTALWLLAVLLSAGCGEGPDERQLAHERFDALYEEAYSARHPETWVTAGHTLIDRYFETAQDLRREATADQAIEFALDELRTRDASAAHDYQHYGELEPVP